MNRYRRASSGFASGTAFVLLLFLATVAGTAWVYTGIVTSERWPIRWLEINGSFQRLSAEQLRASLSSRIGSSFFTVDLGELQRAAARSAWVSAVQVQRIWPDTVSVTVEEYLPVAHWNRSRLISRDGVAFAVPEADDIQGLPWLEGPDARLDEVLAAWVRFDETLLPIGLEIAQLRLDQRGSWSMVLDNGTQIELGRDAAAERLQRLLVSWESLMREREHPPIDVDLRYTHGLAVRWQKNPEEEPGRGS